MSAIHATLPTTPRCLVIENGERCQRRHMARGLCMTHYQRLRRELLRERPDWYELAET